MSKKDIQVLCDHGRIIDGYYRCPMCLGEKLDRDREKADNLASKEAEQNKIVVTISVVSSEIDLDSPILKRSKMPRITKFPGGIKEEEEA